MSEAVALAETEGLNAVDLRVALDPDQQPAVQAALAAQTALCR